MSFASNARDQAVQSATQNAELQVAVKLKQSWGLLSTAALALGRTLPDNPTDADFQRMALELINQRQFTIGGQTLQLSELDDLANGPNPQAAALRGVRDNFRIGSFQELVPTRSQIGLVANAVGNGVYENTGNIGFLRGATIGSALTGLFKWIFSGFRGGFQGLFDTIAENSAGNMRDSVTRNLNNLRNGPNGAGMSLFLNHTTITDIGNSVHSTVMHIANPNNPAPTTTTLASVRIGDIGDTMRSTVQSNLRDTIRQEVLTALANPTTGPFADVLNPNGSRREPSTFWSTAVQFAQNQAARVFSGLGSPQQRQEAAEASANAVSERISTVLADRNYRYPPAGVTPPVHLQALAARNPPLSLAQMSPQDRAAVLADEARRAVETLATQARNAGNNDQAAMYTLIATQMPAAMAEKFVTMGSTITSVHSLLTNQPSNPLVQSLAGQTPTNSLLNTLLNQDATQRTDFLFRTTKAAMGSGPIGEQLAGIAGRPLNDDHYHALATSLSDAIESIRDAQPPVPASGAERYARISEIIRTRLQTDLDTINGADGEDPPLQLSPEMMAIIADQATLQLMGSTERDAPAAFRTLMAEHVTAVGRGAITASLNGQREFLQHLAGLDAAMPENHAAIGAIATAVQERFATHLATDTAKANIRGMRAGAYQTIATQILEDLNNRNINVGDANFSPEARQLLASQMAVQIVQRAYDSPSQAPAPPDTFLTTMRTNAQPFVAALLKDQLKEPATRASLAMLTGRPSVTDGQIDAIAAATAPAVADFATNPPARLPSGGYDPNIYAELANRIYEGREGQYGGLQQAGNLAGLNLSPEARRALANEMAVTVIQRQLGQDAPAIPREFAERRAEAQITTVLQTPDSLRTLRMASGVANMQANHSSITAIAGAAAPTIAALDTPARRQIIADGGQLPENLYADTARDIRAALQANLTTINAGTPPATFSSAALDALADRLAVESINNTFGDNTPNQPETFRQSVRDHLRDTLRPIVHTQFNAADNRTSRNFLTLAMHRGFTAAEQGHLDTTISTTMASLMESGEQNPERIRAAFLAALSNEQNQRNIGLTEISDEPRTGTPPKGPRTRVIESMADSLTDTYRDNVLGYQPDLIERGRRLLIQTQQMTQLQTQIDNILATNPSLRGKIDTTLVTEVITQLVSRAPNPDAVPPIRDISSMTRDELRAEVQRVFAARLGTNTSQILTEQGRTALFGSAGAGNFSSQANSNTIAAAIANMAVPPLPTDPAATRTAAATAQTNLDILLRQTIGRRLHRQIEVAVSSGVNSASDSAQSDFGTQVGERARQMFSLGYASTLFPNTTQASRIGTYVADAVVPVMTDRDELIGTQYLSFAQGTMTGDRLRASRGLTFDPPLPVAVPSPDDCALTEQQRVAAAAQGGQLRFSQLTRAQQQGYLTHVIYNNLIAHRNQINSAGTDPASFNDTELLKIATAAASGIRQNLEAERGLPIFLQDASTALNQPLAQAAQQHDTSFASLGNVDLPSILRQLQQGGTNVPTMGV